MEENETKVIEIISTQSSSSSSSSEVEEDCFILDFNPYESINDINKLSLSNNLPDNDDEDDDEDEDLKVISEKGQVACRDYPHSRHLCIKYPFDKTPPENHCEMCYCYVCDSTAPCQFWTEQAHCHASEHIGDWKSKRNFKKLINLV